MKQRMEGEAEMRANMTRKTAAKLKYLSPFGALLEASESGQSVCDLEIDSLRSLFDENHLLVIRGFKDFSSRQDLVDYCRLWGEISLWPFGEVLELVERQNPEDHIFDHNYVPLHWDGMYRPQVPEIQIFHCVRAPGKEMGGETTFSNTELVLKNASIAEKDLWSRVTGIYERKMEYYESKTIAPVIAEHPTKGFPVIRYCEPPKDNDQSFVNHPNFEIRGISEVEVPQFMHGLRSALYAPANFYAHKWQTGDVVISDNYTLLHGRNAFTSGEPRHLRRVHVLGKPALNNPHLVAHA